MRITNQKLVWLILSLVLFSLQVIAQEKTFDEAALSESGKKAYQTLLKVDFFEMEGIGYSGEASEGKKALRILLTEEKLIALSAFKSLAKTASIEGGLYGLFGLKKTQM